MAERDPWLLTPGPLTTSATVKEAMLHDWGSRDPRFIEMCREVRERLVDLVGGRDTHVCVCMQGSGTFAVEAALGTLVPPDGRLLVLVNGAYGRRIAKVATLLGRQVTLYETDEAEPPDPAEVAARLDADPDVTDVAIVHCETTSGLLNPVERVAEVVAARGRRLLIDGMSAFGALPLDARQTPFTAVMASTNKCLEGVPGMGFVVVEREHLTRCEGHSHSLALDLYDQWRYTEGNGQWRFTPPTQVIAAFLQALDEHRAEGGVAGRAARYRRNCAILVEGLRALGFETYLPDALQAPIIVTFRTPADPKFSFRRLYDSLAERGFLIYPGKLTQADSFRIGCIGRLGDTEMHEAVSALRDSLTEMGVTDGRPRPAGEPLA
jgi:2-aminoethylphosphonate-pyruvate transaminase